MGQLIKKTLITLREDGITGVIKKTAHYIVKGSYHADENAVVETMIERPFVDVLFINGCDSSVPHPARYRVTHQREQLAANNMTSDEVYYIDLKLEQVKNAHMFIFFRCPYTDTIGEFVQLAKNLNKTVLFDIDDLVIDTAYTDTIKYIQQMTVEEKKLYDDGVNRMGHTLKLCEGAITTTERLAYELKKYVPEVYINRNTASERMFSLSKKVIKDIHEDIRIGYFSGSLTHNDDFQMILPVIAELLRKYENLKLYVVGELELPAELEPYKKQIIVSPFIDWEKLPQLIASVDINLAPLESSIFNEAKSENKWVEAALVKVPTVASDVGAFARMIRNEETGFLCRTGEEWRNVLERLITDKKLREAIGEKAYGYVKENCLTLYSGFPITEYLREKMHCSVVFVLPSTEISGGIMVALKHAALLQKNGCDVSILANNPTLEWMEYDGRRFPVIDSKKTQVYAFFDKAVATMWVTLPFVETHPGIKERYYLVQNFETDFYEPDSILRIQANQTYNRNRDIRYITISKWCQKWLKEKFHKDAQYAPNGVDTNCFTVKKRNFNQGKIRILIEGDCAVDYKKVDESFRIVENLDPDRFEVWYMSYNERPKEWYRVDRFLHKIPYEKVPEVYSKCHILLKSSILESFSYPPLEMMASGGYVVVVPNGGNIEYLQDGSNCLFYKSGDISEAVDKIYKICNDEKMREVLAKGGAETALGRDWSQLESQVISLYNAQR